jgi:polygalacturonase
MRFHLARSAPILITALALAAYRPAVAAADTPALAAQVDVSAAENVKPALPRIPARTFKLTDFGAIGDGHTLNTGAFEKALAAVAEAGGGTLLVPAGVFVTRPITLCSNLELHLDAGAVIQAPATFEELGWPNPAAFKTQAELSAAFKMPPALIHGDGLHDVAITGTGTINGMGQHWWDWSERAARAQPGRLVIPRPHLVVINRCDRLHVADVTLTNSSKFHLVPSNINDLTIERVKVRAPFNAPNTDAIDPGPGRNFLIRECDIDTGDDDIVIKSGGTNILIENCTIKHGHGISIGSGTTVGIHNMLVRHCTMDGTDNGIRIKSMRGAGGPVENVRYTDIQMKNIRDAIVLDLNYVDNNRPDFRGDPKKVPSIKNVMIDHVTVESALNAGRIVGLPESPITNITLQDVRIAARKDLVIKDATDPHLVRVDKTIDPALKLDREAYQE